MTTSFSSPCIFCRTSSTHLPISVRHKFEYDWNPDSHEIRRSRPLGIAGYFWNDRLVDGLLVAQPFLTDIVVSRCPFFFALVWRSCHSEGLKPHEPRSIATQGNSCKTRGNWRHPGNADQSLSHLPNFLSLPFVHLYFALEHDRLMDRIIHPYFRRPNRKTD